MTIAANSFDTRYFAIPCFVFGLNNLSYNIIDNLLLFVFGLISIAMGIYILKFTLPTFRVEYDEQNKVAKLERMQKQISIPLHELEWIKSGLCIGKYPISINFYQLMTNKNGRPKSFRFAVYGSSVEGRANIDKLESIVFNYKQANGPYTNNKKSSTNLIDS